jgi:hypothetical protein
MNRNDQSPMVPQANTGSIVIAGSAIAGVASVSYLVALDAGPAGRTLGRLLLVR